MESIDRRKEIVNDCLELLVEKGLAETTTRDLSKAMRLQVSGMYYYFASKDDLIIACAEEAILNVENTLIIPTLNKARNPKLMIGQLLADALKMAPTMKFFVSVCTDKKYEERIKPVLDRAGNRYTQYANRVAKALNADVKEVAPFVFMLITAISNYMVFQEVSFVSPQLKAVQIKFERIVANELEELRKLQKNNKIGEILWR